MKIGKYLLTALMVLCVSGMVYAAPVGLTSEADATKAELWAEENLGLSIACIGDFISDRDIDVAGGEFEMDTIFARIGLSAFDRINLYVDFGQVLDMSYACELNTTLVQVKYEYDDDFIWGIGLNGLLYRWDNGLEIGAGASYRQAEMNIEKATIDGNSYDRAQFALVNDGDLSEWQAAVELAWNLDFFVPYVGIKYSDVEVDGDVTLAITQYNGSGKDAGTNVGGFVGVTLLPRLDGIPKSEQVSINVEARFIDENALNVGLAYKF